MEYSYAENYLLNLYASLVKEKNYDKFKKIYDKIVILYTKEDTFIASNIIKTLNFYYAVSFNKTVNEDYIYNEFLNNEEEALDLIINFYSKIIIKDKIMDLASDNLKQLTYEVRSLNDFLTDLSERYDIHSEVLFSTPDEQEMVKFIEDIVFLEELEK
jgi:hypothetical protein